VEIDEDVGACRSRAIESNSVCANGARALSLAVTCVMRER
jgi:hypothetical protein